MPDIHRKLMRVIVALLASQMCWAVTPAYVTGATAHPGSVSSFTITDSPTNGNLETVAISLSDTTKSVSSITDSGSSAYYFRGSCPNSTSVRLELWSTKRTGVAGSPATLTVNLSGASDVVAATASYSGVSQLGGFSCRTASATAGGTQGSCSANTSLIFNAVASLGTATYSGTNLRSSDVDTTIGVGNGDVAGAGIQCTTKPTITLSGSSTLAAIALELMNRSDTTDGACQPGGTLLQCASGFWGSGAPNVLGYALESPVTAGSLLVAACQLNSNTATWSTADLQGLTYSSVVGPISNGAATGRAQLVRAFNASAGTDVITVTRSTTTNSYCLFAEYGSVLTSNPNDQSSSNTGNSTAADSGNATTTSAAELLIGVVANNGSSAFTAGTGYTIRTSDQEIALEDKIVGVTGTYSAPMTVTSGQWVALIGTFIGSSTGRVRHAVIAQ